MLSGSSWRLLIFVQLTTITWAVDWTYDNVMTWGTDISATCSKGKRQSPIDISTSDAVSDASLTKSPLQFVGYSGTVSGDLQNDGRTVFFMLSSSIANEKRPKIQNGGLSGSYILDSLEFHWGSNQWVPEGSDHHIDGDGAPLEVQFVHFNSKYNSFSDALNHNDGISIVAFLFSATDDPKQIGANYEEISVHLAAGDITNPNQKVTVNVNLAKLLPSFASSGIYYRYDGSFTTPPCTEVVTWTVFHDKIVALESTIGAFVADLLTQHVDENLVGNVRLTNTYRPVQSLNGRKVRTNRLQTATKRTTVKAATTKPTSTSKHTTSKKVTSTPAKTTKKLTTTKIRSTTRKTSTATSVKTTSLNKATTKQAVRILLGATSTITQKTTTEPPRPFLCMGGLFFCMPFPRHH